MITSPLTSRHGWRRLRRPVFIVSIALSLLAGCKRSEDKLPVLHVGDQLQVLQAPLAAAGEDKPKGYRIEFSNFIGGPAVIAAETGGSVDVGYMAETPLVFAQAAGSPVKVVAVSQGFGTTSSNIALVVPTNSPIRSIADLKGKKVAYGPGTVTQYLLARALDSVGLSLNDIRTVQMAAFSPAALDRGIADVFTATEPMLSKSIAEGRIRVLVNGGAPFIPGFGYLVASDRALADPARAKLIADFVARAARAVRWRRENVAKAVPYTAKQFNVSPDLAEAILKRNPQHYTPIDASIVSKQQEEADLFYKLGLIHKRVDAKQVFDERYNPVVIGVEKPE